MTLAREQAPSLAAASGMLSRLAGPKAASVEQMRAAVRQRARRKHAAKRP
jgi:hypothetical protein